MIAATKSTRWIIVLATILLWPGCKDITRTVNHMPEPAEQFETLEQCDSPQMHAIVSLCATQIVTKIKAQEITSTQTLNAFLCRIKRVNPSINAIVTLNIPEAREKAAQADRDIKNGKVWGRLHGLPITVKDSFMTKGLRTTSSFEPLKAYIPNENAVIVQKLLDEGAIIMGKTNLPELAMDSQTKSPLFGITNNPWNVKRTVGGSSGGSAAAVAARMSPLDFGSDLAGSIRLPAHFNGVFALKATEHLISSKGHIPNLPDTMLTLRNMPAFGPIATSLDDVALALKIIAGPAEQDTTIPDQPLTDPTFSTHRPLKIAWTDHFAGLEANTDSKSVLTDLTHVLSESGHMIQKIDMTQNGFDVELAWETWGKLFAQQTGAGELNIWRLIQKIFGWIVVKDIPMQRHVMDQVSVENYMLALQDRDTLSNALEHILEQYDMIIAPVAVSEAFEHHPVTYYFGTYPIYRQPVIIDGNAIHYFLATEGFTIPFNVTGSPVVVIPAGFSKDGLPIGVQLVGSKWHDMDLLSMAQRIVDIYPQSSAIPAALENSLLSAKGKQHVPSHL